MVLERETPTAINENTEISMEENGHLERSNKKVKSSHLIDAETNEIPMQTDQQELLVEANGSDGIPPTKQLGMTLISSLWMTQKSFQTKLK